MELDILTEHENLRLLATCSDPIVSGKFCKGVDNMSVFSSASCSQINDLNALFELAHIREGV